jgi:lipase maturation factor 1
MGSEIELSELKGEFWLTRVVLLRCLGILFLVAFSISLLQSDGLLGDHGLTPASIFMERYDDHFLRNRDKLVADSWLLQVLSKWSVVPSTHVWDHRIVGFLNHPTLYWFFPPTSHYLYLVSSLGCALALLVAILGACNVPIMLAMWLLYFSIVNVGQTWYSFGWESQLLETSFLTCFTLPLISLSRFPKRTPMSFTVRWGLRWLLCRIMLGAGLIKIRGDQCWRDLTCMNYHYQTQPVPNPISIYFHYSPGEFD